MRKMRVEKKCVRIGSQDSGGLGLRKVKELNLVML